MQWPRPAAQLRRPACSESRKTQVNEYHQKLGEMGGKMNIDINPVFKSFSDVVFLTALASVAVRDPISATYSPAVMTMCE